MEMNNEINKDEIIMFLARELEAARTQLSFYVPLIEHDNDLGQILNELTALRNECAQLKIQISEKEK